MIPQTTNSQPEGGCSTDWRSLVTNLKNKDPRGDQELDRVFSDGIRFFLNRSLGPLNLEARARETMLKVKLAVRADEFIPETLASAVRGIVQEQVIKHGNANDGNGSPRRGERYGNHPAEKKIHSDNVAHMTGILNNRTQNDREALSRFYLRAQPQKMVCDELQLDERYFRFMKAEVRARFYEALAVTSATS